MGTTTISPVLPLDLTASLTGFQYVRPNLYSRPLSLVLLQMGRRWHHHLERSLVRLFQGSGSSPVRDSETQVTLEQGLFIEPQRLAWSGYLHLSYRTVQRDYDNDKIEYSSSKC